ncbi:CHASE2 domain-containing protein [Fortiea contorta]|uniref:CHASE2 domain-containing protein n=1 Tax=Fortiea contorta TaxID=1892405 RepID=UPI00034BA85E|nr:CHASE2 domain-containing protein [Fortiea contorta]
MGKLVILKFGEGNFQQGFSVTLQIGDENARPSAEIIGELPPNLEIPLLYENWQSIYRHLDLPARPIGLPKQIMPVATLADCEQAAAKLKITLNNWLKSDSFRSIREKWLEKLILADNIRVILQTNNLQLQKLPWHFWDLIELYSQAEIALSAPIYEQVYRPANPLKKVKILAILGNSQGIDIAADRAILEQLNDANITFLVEPKCQDLTEQLWEESWQILFFAGHSSSQEAGETGQIYINQTESLKISELKFALKKAVERGLKLAIFNSCDGLGLAREFASLQIPQLIVMREPVPDVVAQEFLKHFLSAFSRGESLYLSVREARERLQGLEKKFPCATWLPVICQNPGEMSVSWRELTGRIRPEQLKLRQHLSVMLLASVIISALTVGIRYLGILQPLELQAFDHLLRLRPQEPPDSRLLVVTVTEDDVQAQAQEQGRGSLSDKSLDQLLEKLEVHQPTAIGLDIYRDYPVGKDYPSLAARMRNSDRLIPVCQVSNPQAGKPGVQPPPEVPQERLGFSDITLDPDNVVRRHLLALTPPPASACAAPYSLSMQLALRYLYTKGIQLEFTPDGVWKLGKIQLKPLETHTGGYQKIDALGHQILLNYRSSRSPQAIAPQITLQQALRGKLSTSALKDKIILIGTTAESFNDYPLTPYATSQGNSQAIPGVVLQAQMVSQILSAVLDGRPLLWTWALWGEVMWIWGWSSSGILVAWYLRQSRGIAIAIATACQLVILSAMCLILLTFFSCWVPLIPTTLALIGSNSVVAIRVWGKVINIK